MSVGIHSGLFHFFLVGESHRELLVAGPGATATVTMEATADAGEIVISDATASALRPGVVGASKGPGHLLRRAPAVPADSFLPFEYVDPDLDLLHGIPTGLRDVLSGSHQESEHRRVTVAFIHFDGTDGLIERVGPTETADQLDALVSHVQRAVERQEITFLATDADQDGGKIILTAGAPSTSGDDEHHMLLAVREIMDAHGPLPIRIGVNRGAVFVGEVGPPYRRTFTVMGDAVNLAARLMAKATPGQILITPEILSRSRTGFATEELEPFRVKGKSEPVRALAVGAMTGPRRVGGGRDLPLVGRVTETRTLEQAIGQAKAGTGSLVEIIGEPGAGKSRLVAWLRTAADDMVQLSTVCERYDASTPYHVVGRLLRTLIGLPPEGNSPQVAAAFLTHLEQRTPTVLSRAPLIATALGLSVPETPETRDIDEGFRRARMAEAVIDLLGELLPDSGLLTVEDAHFMDEASADLFGYLAALVGPSSWLICVTRRDGGSAFVAPVEHTTCIALGPLEVDEATELAHLATADAPIPQHRIDALVERSAGNPLFLLELLEVATEGEALAELPDSVEQVVAARIDRLSAGDRRLLRRISVLGQSFPYEVLTEVVDDTPGEFDPAWERLDEFVVRDGLGELSFRSALLRDCAYDGLTFSVRRNLHARAQATPSRARRSTVGRTSPSSSRSITCTPSGTRRHGPTRSSLPNGPRPPTPTSRSPSSTSGRCSRGAACPSSTGPSSPRCTRPSGTRGTAPAATRVLRPPTGRPDASSVTTRSAKPASRSRSPRSRDGSRATRTPSAGSPGDCACSRERTAAARSGNVPNCSAGTAGSARRRVTTPAPSPGAPGRSRTPRRRGTRRCSPSPSGRSTGRGWSSDSSTSRSTWSGR